MSTCVACLENNYYICIISKDDYSYLNIFYHVFKNIINK